MCSEEPHIRDDKSFKTYRSTRENLDWSEDGLPATVEKKEKRILSAVVRDDVPTLSKLLDSPKWYRTVDTNGLSLLHIAVLQNSKRAFDHLLSLAAFPLDMVSDYGETALITSILAIDVDRRGNVKPGDDDFAWRLIEAGADVFRCDSFGCTTLSCAALKHHAKMADRLIQDGVDVNRRDAYGDAALHHAVDHDGADCAECVSLLLENGADAGISNKDGLNAFEKAVLRCIDSSLHEILYYYTYDKCTEMKTNINVLVALAKHRSPLLTHFEDAYADYSDHIQVFDVDVEYLQILIQKFRDVIADKLPQCFLGDWSPNVVTFEKLELFIDSDLKFDIISCIQNEKDHLLFQNLWDLDEPAVCEVACYFLLHGLELTVRGLETIYGIYGYCELFKILLHMDIKVDPRHQVQIMPALLYDVHLQLEDYLENVHLFRTGNVHHLLDYFVNARLNEICYEMYDEEVRSEIKKLPQVPLLVELARNTFRTYFIETFQITNSSQFYTLINNLDVSDVYKKIVTFEKKLY